MKRTNVITLSLSAALIGVLGLGGCGNATAPSDKTKTTGKTDTLQKTEYGYNSVTGKVVIDTTPVNARQRAVVSNEAEIIAYNLDNHSVYKTRSDATGNYTLSGLPDGQYQIVAQNERVAKSSVRTVTLQKQSRVVINFTLTATGTISGKIVGAHVVYLPGTDHISIPREDGSFTLTGVPVGTYMLAYETNRDNGAYQTLSVTVNAGEVTPIDLQVNGGTEDAQMDADNFASVPKTLPMGVLELHHKGLPVRLFRISSYLGYDEVLSDYLTDEIMLKNSAGENIAIHFDTDDYGRLVVRTKEIVPAGDYTLVLSKKLNRFMNENDSDMMTEDHSYTIHVDAFTLASAEVYQGVRAISLYLPKMITAEQKETISSLKVREKGTTRSMPLRVVWNSDYDMSLFGHFKTGVVYEFDLTDEQKAILGTIKPVDGQLMFGQVEVSGIYPAPNRKDVQLEAPIYVELNFGHTIDPATITFTLNNQTFSKESVYFNEQSNNEGSPYPHSQRLIVGLKHQPLAYNTNYTLVFKAKDMSGNPVEATSTFKTVTPAVVELEPKSIEDLFNDRQSARFNTPVDKTSGTITIENLSGGPNAHIKREEWEDYDPYRIDFSIEGLRPNQRYKVIVSGFKDLYGHEVATKSTEFSTPPKMLFIPGEYMQKVHVRGDNFRHKVKLFFFGGLSDAQKEALENNLQVLSYGQPVPVDDTHPVRKLFFEDSEEGTEVTVAFTIDADKNYELVLADKSAFSDIIFPDDTKLLSFSTIKAYQDGENDPNAVEMVRYLRVLQPHLEFIGDPNGEEQVKMVAPVEMEVRLPFAVIPNDGGQNRNCYDIYKDQNIAEKADRLVAESLKVTQNGQEVEIAPPHYLWSVRDDWKMSGRICSVENRIEYYYGGYGDSPDAPHHAAFAADYNKTYEVTLDLGNGLTDKVATKHAKVTKVLKTAPIGSMHFRLENTGIDEGTGYNGGETSGAYPSESESEDMAKDEAIWVVMHSNAPIKTDNLDRLFTVKVNGEPYIPQYDYDRNDENMTMEIRFPVPRTLYSVLQVEIAKADGEDMTFVNPMNGQTVVNNGSLAHPVTIMEDVLPDFVPVKVEDVHTLSVANQAIAIDFNRVIAPGDIATIAEDGTLSDVKFEVKADDGSTVAITGIEGSGKTIVLQLANPLETTKQYTLSLKSGKTIKAAFGAQELKTLQKPVQLTFIQVGEAFYLKQNTHLPENTEYLLGSTNIIYADYNNNMNQVMLPLMLKEGVLLDANQTTIDVTDRYNNNAKYNAGGWRYENGFMIQPISGNPYDVSLHAHIAYRVGDQAYAIDKKQQYVNSVQLPYVYRVYGNGANALTFEFSNMREGYQINPSNFEVYDINGTEIDAQIAVQFDDQYSMNRPTVTFGDLQPDSMYRLVIKGIPSYDANYLPDEVVANSVIETMMIQTPQQQGK